MQCFITTCTVSRRAPSPASAFVAVVVFINCPIRPIFAPDTIPLRVLATRVPGIYRTPKLLRRAKCMIKYYTRNSETRNGFAAITRLPFVLVFPGPDAATGDREKLVSRSDAGRDTVRPPSAVVPRRRRLSAKVFVFTTVRFTEMRRTRFAFPARAPRTGEPHCRHRPHRSRHDRGRPSLAPFLLPHSAPPRRAPTDHFSAPTSAAYPCLRIYNYARTPGSPSPPTASPRPYHLYDYIIAIHNNNNIYAYSPPPTGSVPVKPTPSPVTAGHGESSQTASAHFAVDAYVSRFDGKLISPTNVYGDILLLTGYTTTCIHY